MAQAILMKFMIKNSGHSMYGSRMAQCEPCRTGICNSGCAIKFPSLSSWVINDEEEYTWIINIYIQDYNSKRMLI